MTPTELNEKFALPGALEFEATPGGLTRAVVSTPLAEADVYLQGAAHRSLDPLRPQTGPVRERQKLLQTR